MTYIPVAEQKALAEKAAEDKRVALNALFAKNRIFAFNCGKPRDPMYPEVREANPLQKQLLEAWENHNYKVFTYTGGNRIGKTTISVILAISVCAGEWPWSGKKMQFGHDLPRKIRYVGQAFESHIKAVLEPALKYWWPEAYILKTKKNNQGIDSLWQLYSRDHKKGLLGSIEIMSNSQDSSMFEGWNGDVVIYDEPPKRDVRVACARGLIDRGGRELFAMTLLSEAWVQRDIIKATLPDGTPDMTVFNINGDIYSNVGYGLKKEAIEQFAKTLTDDEKQARLFGKPSYMTSLVFPRFDRQKHVKERFQIPLDALVDVSIDFHPSKPWAMVFMATTKSGIKYICDEIKFRGNPKSAAEELIRVIRMRDYARVNRIIIDPLAKSGQGNDIDVYSIFADALAAFNYNLETASKEKDSGISILNSLLWTENEMPGLYYFKDCGKTIEETENLLYDPDTFKPQKVDDDYTECSYRLALLDTEWYPPYEHNQSQGKSVVL